MRPKKQPKQKQEITFDDGSGMFGKDEEELTFQSIVLKQVQKICDLGSKELRGGYWIQKVKTGEGNKANIEKIYVPDTREEYSNAINMLHDVLLNNFDDDMCDESDAHDKKLDELRVNCIRKTSVDEQNVLGTNMADTMILSAESYDATDRKIVEAYKYVKLKYMRKLLQSLMMFCDRKWHWGVTNPLDD